MERIQSFKSFSDVKKQIKEKATLEETNVKRATSATAFAELLKKYEAATIADVTEDKLQDFMSELVGNFKFEKSNESVEAEVIEEGNKNREMVASAWMKTGVKDLNGIAKLYADAMEDANFHQERGTSKAIGSASRGKVSGLKGSDIASAAGWDGYAIANGTVDFLREIGEEAAANKLYKAISKYDLNESIAFATTDLVTAIMEGTRGQFGKIYKSGEIASVYTHYDSYPEHMLPTIKKGYKKGADVDAVLGKGDNSGLEVSPDKMKFYGDPNSLKPMMGTVKNLKKYVNDADAQGAEYIYLFDERDQKWYMVDVYGDRDLVPAFEAVEVNEGISPEVIVMISTVLGIPAMALAGAKLDSALEKAAKNGNEFAAAVLSKLRSAGKAASSSMRSESVVNEAEVDIMDEVGGDIHNIYGKLNDLAEETTDTKWRKAIESIIKGLEGVENKIGQAANKLGVVPTHESEEVAIEEAEINNEEEFRAYAEEVLKKAHGEDYDEAKAKETIDGILAKADGDFGAAIGMLTSGLGEAVEANEDMVPGGLSDNMTAQELADKHGVDVAEIEAAIEKGVKVEMEHTDDEKIAHEVAMDHIFEDPKYYDKLANMENESETVEEGNEEKVALELYVKLVDKEGEFTEDQMSRMSLEEIEDYLKDNEDLRGSQLKKVAKEVYNIATSK